MMLLLKNRKIFNSINGRSEKQYGALKNSPIQGKEHIVQFLKEYRDSLKELVDQLAAS